MKKRERIEELERRVRELEARPYFVPYYQPIWIQPQFVPYVAPRPVWITTTTGSPPQFVSNSNIASTPQIYNNGAN